MKKLNILVAVGLLPCIATAQPVVRNDSTYPLLPRTQVHLFHSAVNGRDIRLIVSVPADYTVNTSVRYPVLYLLDGVIALPAAANAFRVSHGPNYGLILVGVTYGDPEKALAFRTVDYTPPPHKDSATVRAAARAICAHRGSAV